MQGFGIFETTDDGASWTPRNKGLRADWPIEDPEVGYCVHKLVMSPVDTDRLYQQNHVGMHRSDDGGHSWMEITEGLPTEFGFAAAAHPHDRDTFYVIPLDPGHGRCMPEGRAAVWRTRDAGSTWQRLDAGLPQRDAHLGVLREGMAIDALDVPGPLLRHQHGTGVRERRRGRELERDRELPAGDLVGRGRGARVAMADLHLPSTLLPLFPDLPRRLDVDAATVDEAIARLDERWPGLRDRLCEPGPALRPHINVYVDRERAGARHGARRALAGRRDRRDQRRLRRVSSRSGTGGAARLSRLHARRGAVSASKGARPGDRVAARRAASNPSAGSSSTRCRVASSARRQLRPEAALRLPAVSSAVTV